MTVRRARVLAVVALAAGLCVLTGPAALAVPGGLLLAFVLPGLALTTLRTAAVQVRAANETVSLAQRELEMARDRFSAGVGDNLEVVSAQTSLANARDAQVTALAQHNAARLNLAAALGRAETFRW